jgi:hypothetical protein
MEESLKGEEGFAIPLVRLERRGREVLGWLKFNPITHGLLSIQGLGFKT